MSNKDHSKPLMLYVAELIYLEVVEIKKRNPNITNIVSIEMFIGSKTYNEISSGKYHDNLFKKLKENDFINQETGLKIPRETLDLLNLQKKTIIDQLSENTETYFAKSSFPLSNSQNAFNLLWRMCETYELWCNEIGKKITNSLKILS
tara:strand:+ start:92 stop:535 length:444 start_codon:yes stop_codon:yes gene_type:complete